MKLFHRVKPDAELENKAVSELIAEQRKKESVEVWRRGWCIGEAVCVADDQTAEGLIKMAEAIYDYVYGSDPEAKE